MIDQYGVLRRSHWFPAVHDQILCKKNLRNVEYNMLPLRIMYVPVAVNVPMHSPFCSLQKRPQPLIARGMSKHA